MMLLFSSHVNKIFTFGIKDDKDQGGTQICQEYIVKLLLQNIMFYSIWLRIVYQDSTANGLTYCYCNKSFQKAGNQKLAAMQRATNLHRSIIIKEWEHKKLKMEIEDLQDHLLNLQSMKVEKKGLLIVYFVTVNNSNMKQYSQSLLRDEDKRSEMSLIQTFIWMCYPLLG
jgi:hypothetical protein